MASLRHRALFLTGTLTLACGDEPPSQTGDSSSEESSAEASGTDETGPAETGETGEPEPEGFEPFDWPDETLSDYIDPMIGTGGVGYTVGTMNPGPALPFSMIKAGPDTGLGPLQIGFMNCTGYHYDQLHLWGFSHSRINGMGVPDYGAVQVMATTGFGPDQAERAGSRAVLDHAGEVAAAGYYAVDLPDHGIRAELTTAEHAARYRFTWDEPSAEATLVFDLGYNPAEGASSASTVAIDPGGQTLTGMMTVQGSYSKRFGGVPTYFAARVSQPVASHGVWDDMGMVNPDLAALEGAEIGAYLGFDLSGADEPVVELELAISYLSVEQAEANLAELEGSDFDATRADAASTWDDTLERIRVLGGSEDERQLFYSALYRSLLAPTIFSEDGQYRGFDGAVHDDAGATYYSDFSLWDTYRTTHPLFNLIARDRHADMMQSLVRMAEQGGDLPKWPLGLGYTGGMVGTSADIVLADAYLHDVSNFDVDTAYAAARQHAIEPAANAGRADVEGYRARGWVASDVSGASASRTLEFGHADYALANWAAALGYDEDAAMFQSSARAYEHLLEPELGFLIGRRADGSFETEGFDPLVWMDYYSEGTALHYLWSVPHDATGLAELLGGEAEARARLLGFFEDSAAFLDSADYNPIDPVGTYWHANEPSLHVPYLFSDLGDPSLTQRWVDWAKAEHYGHGPHGLPGNDDAGTMSAWYVFASIGLYPLPGSERYWITAPSFERVELDLSDADNPERRLAIVADNAGPGMIYVAGARFNGVELDSPYLSWSQLREAGGTLRLELASEPSDFGRR